MKESLGGRTSVSSSKIMTILGRNHFMSTIEQFYIDIKKIKQTVRPSGLQKMTIGKLIEPIIKDAVENHLGIKLLVDKKRYRHDEFHYFTVEFDAVDKNTETIYEFKNTEMDEDHLLEYYYAQVQFAMYIIGWNKAVIAYLRNGWELGYIEVERDEDFIEKAVPILHYYNSCVESKIEPDADYIYDLTSDINFFKKEDTGLKGVGETIEFTDEETEMLYSWADVKLELGKIEKENDTFKNYFEEKFGSYKDPALSYSNTEYIRKGGFDSKLFMKDHPEIDFSSYYGEDKTFKRQQLRLKKGFKDSRVENTVNKLTKDIV